MSHRRWHRLNMPCIALPPSTTCSVLCRCSVLMQDFSSKSSDYTDDSLVEVVERVAASVAAFQSWTGQYRTRSAMAPENISADKELLSFLDRQFSQGVCLVRNALNTHARINQLPEDILRAIFKWLCPHSFGNFLPDPFGNDSATHTPTHQQSLRRWSRITSVCRLWREVALSSPTMWSTIAVGPDITPNEAIEMQLRYSASAPIDFHVWFTERQSVRCAPYDWARLNLQTIIPRLRSFHLHAAQYLFQLRIYSRLTLPAPLLEHLTLTPECLPFFGLEGETPLAPTLPTVFAGHTPRLASLTLAYFTRWPGNNFKNLTCLCLMHQKTYQWTWDTTFLFKFLNASAGLEELVFFYTAALRDDRCHNDSTALLRPCLARLKTLVMTGWDTASSSLFLSCLELSASCVVVIAAVEGGQTGVPDDCTHLSSYLRSMTRLSLCTDYGNPSPLHVLACGQSGLYYKLEYWPGFSIGAPQPTGVPAWTEAEYIRCIPTLPTFLRLYSMMDLRELRVEIHSWIDVGIAQWTELYNAMPGVTKLVVVVHTKWGEPQSHCLNALATGEAGQMCLPDLTELHVIHKDEVAESFTAALRDAMSHRARHGVAIQKLIVGAHHPLQFPTLYLRRLEDDLGLEIVPTSIVEPFDLSPFDQRGKLYSYRYWPNELRGDGNVSEGC